MKTRTTAALGLAVALAQTALPQALAAQDTTVRLGYSTLFNTGLVLYMAEVAPEIYANHGVRVELVDMRANAPNCIAAMLARTIDMCSISSPTGMFAVVEGAPLTAIAVVQGPLAQIYLSAGAVARSGVSPDAPVADRLRGMAGLNIVTASPGTLYYNMLEHMLRSVDLSISDMTYRTLVDQVAMKEGLSNGSFDSALWSAGAFADLEASGAISGWISVPAGDVPELALVPTVTVFAHNEYLAANPGVDERLHAAMVDVIAALRADPERYSPEIKARNFPDMDQTVWDASYAHGIAGLFPSGQVSEADWNGLLDIQRANNPDRDFAAAEWANLVAPVARAD